MAAYSILFKVSVQKDFSTIPKSDALKILRRIESLADDPRPRGCEKLTDRELYRIRQGRYRIVYSIHDKELHIVVIAVGHRKDIYR